MSQKGFLWVDVDGLSLTQEDKEVLSHPMISGVILFSRNFESISQIKALTHEIRNVSSELVITVDQEGGRVQRFREGFTELKSMGEWGEQYQRSPEKTRLDFSNMLSTMITELKNVGVYSTLVPVLDINYDRNAVIGHRSFGADASLVSALGSFMIDQCHALNMPVTGKHFPGHGWVNGDSHQVLPIDERPLHTITEHDIHPFKASAAKMDAIMLAHIVYNQVDPLPVCFSRFWIQDVLRQQLQYDGLVMSDDLSMKAMDEMGGYDDRANLAREAGCDVMLVCNSRAGVVNILDRTFQKSNPDLTRRMNRYVRFLR